MTTTTLSPLGIRRNSRHPHTLMPGCEEGQHRSRLLKTPSSIVLARVPTCDVPQGYASVVPLPAALLAEILSSLWGLRKKHPP